MDSILEGKSYWTEKSTRSGIEKKKQGLSSGDDNQYLFVAPKHQAQQTNYEKVLESLIKEKP